MKIVVFGDIHGRIEWGDILQKEQPDLTIFLGDYVSTHENISSEQQLANLEDILNYKEQNADKVILLRGNHDIQHLGYYWAECSGFDRNIYKYFCDSYNSNRFLKNTQWTYVYDKYVFSHAGISKTWWNNMKFGEVTKENILKINEIEPCEYFGFCPDRMSDYTGDSVTQPLTWIRPFSLIKDSIEEFVQVVGHTRINSPGNIFENGRLDKDKQQYNIKIDECWFIDCMPYQYMVIEDGKSELRKNSKIFN